MRQGGALDRLTRCARVGPAARAYGFQRMIAEMIRILAPLQAP